MPSIKNHGIDFWCLAFYYHLIKSMFVLNLNSVVWYSFETHFCSGSGVIVMCIAEGSIRGTNFPRDEYLIKAFLWCFSWLQRRQKNNVRLDGLFPNPMRRRRRHRWSPVSWYHQEYSTRQSFGNKTAISAEVTFCFVSNGVMHISKWSSFQNGTDNLWYHGTRTWWAANMVVAFSLLDWLAGLYWGSVLCLWKSIF